MRITEAFCITTAILTSILLFTSLFIYRSIALNRIQREHCIALAEALEKANPENKATIRSALFMLVLEQMDISYSMREGILSQYLVNESLINIGHKNDGK